MKPPENSADILRTKVLVMLVGPSAIGKSSLMHTVTKLDPDFGYVRSFTTRPARAGEQTYEFISDDGAKKLQESGQAITYTEFPATGYIYGTTVASYSARYNLLDTLSHSVEQYRRLPFEKTLTISLSAPADDWQRWFVSRYPVASDEAEKRLAEARQSIMWSLSQDDNHAWFTNTPASLEVTAGKLVGLVRHDQPSGDGPAHAKDMLERIERGIWT